MVTLRCSAVPAPLKGKTTQEVFCGQVHRLGYRYNSPRNQTDVIEMPSINLSLLRLDFQNHECLIEEIVHKYLAQIVEGETLAPITVRFDGES